MGLDITAYRKLTKVENPQIDEDGELVNWETKFMGGASMEWSEEHFPGRGEGIDPNAVYTWEDKIGFRAGSYSGYNWWRDRLENFSDGTAFQELINFSDCEGVIGFVVSAKLAKDFKEHGTRAKEYAETLGGNGSWWLEKYMDWLTAFVMAADGGAVEFH